MNLLKNEIETLKRSRSSLSDEHGLLEILENFVLEFESNKEQRIKTDKMLLTYIEFLENQLKKAFIVIEQAGEKTK